MSIMRAISAPRLMIATAVGLVAGLLFLFWLGGMF